MTVKYPVAPIRVNCPLCGAAAGHKCVQVALDPETDTYGPAEPIRAVAGYHPGREHKARHGWV